MHEPVALRHLVVVGLMGTGKTTTGSLVADRLGWPLRDSDAEIEARTGRSVRELREDLGTDAIHELEATMLLEALAGDGPDVVCAAASVVDREDCRTALRGDGVAVAWLTVSPTVGAERFRSGHHRPWYGDDPETFLAAQARSRGPWFDEVAAVQIATDHATPDEVAAAIVEAMQARGLLPAG